MFSPLFSTKWSFLKKICLNQNQSRINSEFLCFPHNYLHRLKSPLFNCRWRQILCFPFFIPNHLIKPYTKTLSISAISSHLCETLNHPSPIKSEFHSFTFSIQYLPLNSIDNYLTQFNSPSLKRTSIYIWCSDLPQPFLWKTLSYASTFLYVIATANACYTVYWHFLLICIWPSLGCKFLYSRNLSYSSLYLWH